MKAWIILIIILIIMLLFVIYLLVRECRSKKKIKPKSKWTNTKKRKTNEKIYKTN